MSRPPATAEARELRVNQLLDAAIALWQQHPDRIPSVAEVASEAELAKGTVYLYFKCKEDLLLAAHERHVQAFFAALIARASQSRCMDFDDVMQLVRDHVIGIEAFLPLLRAHRDRCLKGEPGTLGFEILRPEKNLMLYEVYDSQAAFEAHQQTPHFKRYLESAVPLLESRERTFFTRVAP